MKQTKQLAITFFSLTALMFLAVFAAAEGDFTKTVGFFRWAIGV